ncbi:MAG: hypothetical protein KJ721_00130, partial [Nanoarchaeota archaeon]|nr:hypothetical protein [Nanoarchaeota archaeon]
VKEDGSSLINIEEAREIHKELLLIRKYGDEVAKERLKVKFKEIENTYQDEIAREKQLEKLKANPNLVNVGHTVVKNKDSIEIPYTGGRVANGKMYGIIEEGSLIHTTDYKGTTFTVKLKDQVSNGLRGVEGVYSEDGSVEYKELVTNVGTIKEKSVTEKLAEEIKNNMVFRESDASTYNNKYIEPKLSYYETEPSKGFPAIVPFDCTNGWYVSAKQVTGGAFGGFNAYDASGVARNYYICNVGPNNKEENQGGDDDCQMINKGTGQPDVFSGLDSGKAKTLGKAAESALIEASRKYKSSGSGDVKIGNCNVKIGSPAVDIPDMQCQDFMSPSDCNLMFNVCDPVVCPSSRCDFGGTYPVKDVIQSGIIGSALLCLPNAREGIKIPVCLSGIKAGIDGLLSVYHSYRDCLQESLDTGKMIGICDEIYSIHMCEFFWRQSLPLAKIIIPKMMEIALGQNVRGGGEYMGVATAWANAEKSIDYFAQYYAATSYQAFKARIVEGVGDAVCQNSISASYPDGGSVLDSLTDPDSPPQFHGRFDEIEFTTATNPPISQYKVYYHIYAGKESRAYFQVYLKGDTGSSFYQDVSGKRPVASGYIATGEYASETKDFTAPSGYKQLCINVNGQEECGFQEVSTSFAINYVEDKYKEEQALQTDIKSEQECVSGSASAYSLLTPNLQSAGEELINPEIYNHGIIRICATNNPGKGTDGNVGTNASRWVEVGYCDKTNNIRCWQDEDSVKNTIKSLDIEGNVLKTQSENTLKILMDEGKYITDFKTLSDEIDKLGGVAKIDKITSVINRVFYNAQKAYLYLKRGDEYGKLAGVGKSRSDSEKTATVESPEKPAVVEPISGDSGVGDGENGLIELSTAPYQCGNLKVMGEKYQRAVGEYVILTINQKEENGKLKLTEEMRNSVMVDTKDIRNFKCLVLQQAFQESCLAHCLYAEDKDTYDYCNNNLDTIVKGDDSNSIGVMQLNNKYFDQSKSVDIGWNINEGIDYLITSYNYCKNNQGVSNWNAALNRYNGLGCKVDADYSTKVLGRKDEVDKLFPELCGDGTSTNPEGETTIPGISPGMVEPNGEVAI